MSEKYTYQDYVEALESAYYCAQKFIEVCVATHDNLTQAKEYDDFIDAEARLKLTEESDEGK